MKNNICRLSVLLSITLAFFVVEIVSGYIGQSLALISDSFNMLSDSISLLVGLIAATVAKMERKYISTYGFARAEVVGALSNAAFLTALHFTIFVEAIIRLINPAKVEQPALVLVVGVLGLIINLVGLLLFLDCSSFKTVIDCTKDNKEVPPRKNPSGGNLNLRGVLLHVSGDALGSIVVIISAIVFYIYPLNANELCNWECYVDPALTILMVIIVISSAFVLMKEVALILLQAVPPNVHLKDLVLKLHEVYGLKGFHELHIWELADRKNIASIHINCTNTHACESIKVEVRKIFHNADIHSITIQTEFDDKTSISSLKCNYPCILEECEEKLCCPNIEKYISRPNRRLSHISRISFALESDSFIFYGSTKIKHIPTSEENNRPSSATSFLMQ